MHRQPEPAGLQRAPAEPADLRGVAGYPGCEAVLPQPDFCSTHPSDPTCVIFSGGAGDGQNTQGTPVAQAVQTTVQLINSSAPAITGSTADKSDKEHPAGRQA
jgi:hypothetical protein